MCARRTENGVRQEPIEELVCEVDDGYSGAVIEAVTLRRGEVRPPACPCPALANASGGSRVHTPRPG